MPDFKLQCNHPYSSTLNTLEFEAETLTEVIAYLDQFLRGCGYHYDGFIDVVTPEPVSPSNPDYVFNQS